MLILTVSGLNVLGPVLAQGPVSQLTVNNPIYDAIFAAESDVNVGRTVTLWPLSRTIWVRWYQDVSILDFIAAEEGGGGGHNWSCKT